MSKKLKNFKLLLIFNLMNICQPQQATEPGRKALETNGEEANPEESNDYDVCVEDASQGCSSRSSNGASNAKRYLHQRVEKNLEDKLRVS